MKATKRLTKSKNQIALYQRVEYKFEFFVDGLTADQCKELGDTIVKFCEDRNAMAGGNLHGVKYYNGRRVK